MLVNRYTIGLGSAAVDSGGTARAAPKWGTGGSPSGTGGKGSHRWSRRTSIANNGAAPGADGTRNDHRRRHDVGDAQRRRVVAVRLRSASRVPTFFVPRGLIAYIGDPATRSGATEGRNRPDTRCSRSWGGLATIGR